MGVLDLYEPDFPHGTPAGFDRGCKGSACSNRGTDAPTCATARSVYVSDYGYRRLVQAGKDDEASAYLHNLMVPPDLGKVRARIGRGDPSNALVTMTKMDPERPPAPKPAKPRPVPKPVFSKAQEAATPKPAPAPTPIVHGTTAGYQRGCRDDCPATPSCRTAMAAYHRQYKRDKKAAAAAGVPFREFRAALKANPEPSCEYSEPLEPSPVDPSPLEQVPSRTEAAPVADVSAVIDLIADTAEALMDAIRTLRDHFTGSGGQDDHTLAR